MSMHDDHAALVAQYDAQRARIEQAVDVLRAWSDDAATLHAAMTAQNRGMSPAEQREVVRRLGLFFGHLADLIDHQYGDLL